MKELVLPVRVYLEDTDAQGVVYNASYFRFMERARTEWLRAQGVDHDELRETHGVMLVLAAIEAQFRAPAQRSPLRACCDRRDARRAHPLRTGHSPRRSRRRGRVRRRRGSRVHRCDRGPTAAFSAHTRE
jgi:Thioesterase-like superfamily